LTDSESLISSLRMISYYSSFFIS